MSAFTLRMLDARVRMRLEKNIRKFYCTRNLAIFSFLTRPVGNLPTTNQFPPVYQSFTLFGNLMFILDISRELSWTF